MIRRNTDRLIPVETVIRNRDEVNGLLEFRDDQASFGRSGKFAAAIGHHLTKTRGYQPWTSTTVCGLIRVLNRQDTKLQAASALCRGLAHKPVCCLHCRATTSPL